MEIDYPYLPGGPKIVRVKLNKPPYGVYVLVFKDPLRIKPDGTLMEGIGQKLDKNVITEAWKKILKKYLEKMGEKEDDIGETTGSD